MSTETINRMPVGINYPWIDYAWDFGIPPAAWVKPGDLERWREEKRAKVREDFRTFSNLGLFAVRWFMLADGLSYGVGDEAPRLIDGRWRFDPLSADHPFHRRLCEDFEFVLDVCAETGIKFLPSLIDFHWCYPGKTIDEAGGIVKCGRGDIIRDPAKRRHFLDAVLEPLLDISARRPEVIYAWELINEPEWVTRRRFFGWLQRDPNRTVSHRAMIAFIREGMQRINARLIRSTVGFAHWDAMHRWGAGRLGMTAPQFHYYAPDEREIPDNNFPSGTPCFVGEFATTCLRCWPDLTGTDLERPIQPRLQMLEGRGYSAAFLWSARAKDNATSWEAADHHDTLAFVSPPADDHGDVPA